MRLRGAAVGTMAALVALGAPAGAVVPPAADPVPGPAPAWLTYNRPADYTAIVTKKIQVPVRDGSWLSCDLYQPGRNGAAVNGRFPAVFDQFHAYGNNRALNDPSQLTLLAERGYVAMQCNVRGTGGTPGVLDVFSDQEARDGYDAVEWLAAQSWSDGDVGMVGYSYGATSTWRVASLRPPHLRTIVPQTAFSDVETDFVHLGGARTADARGWLLGLLPAFNAEITPAEQLPGIVQRGQEIDAEWAAHPTRDSYWNRYAIDVDALRASGIPILAFGGWYDVFQRGVPANYQRLRDQTWLVMDNVTHLGESQSFFGKNSGPTLCWLDHWLQPTRHAPLPGSRVTSNELPKAGGGWTELADWPPPGTQSRTLSMNTGVLSDAPEAPGTTSYVVDGTDGMPSYWNVETRPDSAGIVEWQTAKEAGRTHWTTAPLDDDLVVAGSPLVSLDAAFTATDGVLVARLSDVAPNGDTTLVSTGWLRAATAHDRSRAVPVTPGQVSRYDVEIWPTHWRFAPGHRVQISISSGDVPRLHPDTPPGTVTLTTGTSSLQLPVLAADPDAVVPEVPVAALLPLVGAGALCLAVLTRRRQVRRP
jgi:putative CocE/NonD family hydrolase